MHVLQHLEKTLGLITTIRNGWVQNILVEQMIFFVPVLISRLSYQSLL